MKSRILILMTLAFLATPSYGAWTDTQAAVTTVTNAWHEVKVKVTTKVNEWLAYWNGTGAPAAIGTATAASNAPATAATAPAPSTTAATQKAPAPAPASAEAKALEAQPLYVGKTQSSSLADVKAARDSVKAAQVLKVTPGRKGTTTLPKTKAGVPVSNFAKLRTLKIKKVPRLDIGTESLLSREDFALSNLHWDVQQTVDLAKLPQPASISPNDLKKWSPKLFAKATAPKDLQDAWKNMPHPVTMEMVDKVNWTVADLNVFQEKPYQPLTESQMKMLAALILFSKGGHCQAVMGLFHELAGQEPTKIESLYHLGACSSELKMHQTEFDSLTKVIGSESPDYASPALAMLAKDLPPIYEKDFYKAVKGVKNLKALITDKSRDDVSYRFAKGAYRAGDFKTATTYAQQVSTGSQYSDDARFLVAMSDYARGEKTQALKSLQDLWNSLEQRHVSNSNNIRALTSLNLARMYFAQKKFTKALDYYMKMPKDHPLWVQALIEQGWTQVMLEDYAGAIGNMYSLHSPYFKAVYQPESFVVRTIGYLNICQYGDAYKTLTWLQKDYSTWLSKESNYLETKGNPANIYATVKNYIRGKSTSDVDGVPYQVWREMAHRKDFLNTQLALNDMVDESHRYSAVNDKMHEIKASLLAHADQAKKRFDNAGAQITKAKHDMVLAKNLDSLRNTQRLEREYTIGYRFLLALLEKNRVAYQDFLHKAESRLQSQDANLSQKAGEILLTHAKTMQKDMSRDLDNNEFLRYEVFAGSGENIRYQVAGGKVGGDNRIPANIKPQKMMNWDFDGEFWEDEIGSYRSSLQNNCPSAQRRAAAAASAGVGHRQAARSNDDDEN